VSYKLGVIGFGNIAQAIITPLLQQNLIKPNEVICLVNSKKSFENIKKFYKFDVDVFHASSNESHVIWKCPTKLLSIKPQQLHNIEEIKTEKKSDQILVSILAGISINKLEQKFPNHKCVRAVTNIPITIRNGLTAISWGDKIDKDEKNFVRKLFECSSKVFEFTEEYLDVFLALTSSSPAIIALIVEALSDGGLNGGLSKKLSEELVLEMILGTILLLKNSKITTADLKNMVTSPGGTTISALRVLEEKSLRSALIEAIIAATNKSKEFS
tara:strand:- start:3190 stop:4002 length:813 start_codon:yes stop_codon:yes gene_type:complete